MIAWDERTREGEITTGVGSPRVGLGRGFELGVTHRVKVVTAEGRLRPATTGYMYQLICRDRSLLEFHYHPDVRRAPDCHLHVGAEAEGLGIDFDKIHIPTGRIAFEDVLLMLIDDFGIPARRRARTVLAEERRRFERTRTWADRRPV